MTLMRFLVLAMICGVVASSGAFASSTRTIAKHIPDGVYRDTITKADILRRIPNASAQLIQLDRGTFTWTFRKGTLKMVQVGGGDSNYASSHWKGTYTTTPALLTIRWSVCEYGCPPIERVFWSFDGKALQLRATTRDPETVLLWNTKPFVKIG